MGTVPCSTFLYYYTQTFLHKHACTRTHTHARLHRLGVRPYIRVNIGDMKVVDKVQGAHGCVYLWSQVNRRRRKLKRLDTDRLLTAAGFIGRVDGQARRCRAAQVHTG